MKITDDIPSKQEYVILFIIIVIEIITLFL